MADDELKKLKRTDLLDRLLEVMRENEQLRAEISEMRAQLAERQLDVMEAGSIAEASLKLNDVFKAAQEAADQYLDNIERLYKGRGELVREAQSKAQALVAQAKLDAEAQMEQVRIDADADAEQIRAAARVAADEARAQARKAQEEADEARRSTIRAQEEAAETVRQARDEALSLVEQAKAEAAEAAEQLTADAKSEAEALLVDAKSEAETLLADAKRNAETLLADARLKAQLRMDEAERVCRNFEMATKVKCDNTMRRAMDEAHTYGNTMRMAMHALGIKPEMVPALEEAAQSEGEKPSERVTSTVSQLDEAVSNARAAVAAAISNAKTTPGTLDDETVAAMYPNSAEQL